MTSSPPLCSPLHPAMGVAGSIWLTLLQPWDSPEQGVLPKGGPSCCLASACKLCWQAGQQSLGSLGCRESWNQAVEKTADADLLAPEQNSGSAPVLGMEQGPGSAPVPGVVLL